jgi:WD40-like Beta Propeller Repeat
MGKANCPASIYSSRLIGEKYQTAEKEAYLNINGDNESIFVSADETFAIISNVTQISPNADLYISFRNQNNEWSSPARLDSTINTSNWELRPFVSADNKYLFFTRMSFGANGLNESDIYWVSIERILKSNGCKK